MSEGESPQSRQTSPRSLLRKLDLSIIKNGSAQDWQDDRNGLDNPDSHDSVLYASTSSTATTRGINPRADDSPILSGRKFSRASSPVVSSLPPLSASMNGPSSGPSRPNRSSSTSTKDKKRDHLSSPRKTKARRKPLPPSITQPVYRVLRWLGLQTVDTEEGTSLYWNGFRTLRVFRLLLLLFSLLLAAFVIQTRLFPRKAKKPVAIRDIYRANAARREAQIRLTNPQLIPYEDLFSLNSTFGDQEINDIPVSILFLPSADASPALITKAVDQLNTQSITPMTYHVPPTLSSASLLDAPVQAALPAVDLSHFTLVLPISHATDLVLGPTVLENLLKIAGTKEFSGLLLDIGCSQAAFVQTTWLETLDLSLDVKGRLAWEHRGLEHIMLPLVEEARSINEFWVEGLQDPASCPRQNSPAHFSGFTRNTEPERIIFMLEGVESFEESWKELICEFASRTKHWEPQVLVSSRKSGKISLECDHGVPLKSEAVTAQDWPSLVQPDDVLVYQLATSCARQIDMLANRQWISIGLPPDEVRFAIWAAALNLEALRNWHGPQIDIAVITNNRPVSLTRLTNSLRSAHYFGDRVWLGANLDQTADPVTKQMMQNMKWPHGPFTLRHRIVHGGLMPAIVESWYPSSNDTYGVLLEDDIEVSPLFYAWLKFAILHYRYTRAGKEASTRLFGISLYSPKNVELRLEGRQPFDARNLFHEFNLPVNSPYLSQVPCSWGAAYFPEVWTEFHNYLGLRLGEIAMELSDVIVPDCKSNKWPRSWKKYFIELAYTRGYSMLYPNYDGFMSFSNNHLEMGTHIHVAEVDIKKKIQFEVPLMPSEDASTILDLPDSRLPEWDDLPMVDLWGLLATEEEVIARGYATLTGMAICESPLYDLARAPTYEAGELLCPRNFEPTTNLDAEMLMGVNNFPLPEKIRGFKIAKD